MDTIKQSTVDNNLSLAAKDVYNYLMDNGSIEEKLKSFKKFLSSVNKDDNQHIRDLITIYFLLPSKHPVKSSIQSYFNQVTDEKPEAIKIFMYVIQTQTEEHQTNDLVHDCMFVNHLNELSQNFKVASIAVGRSSHSILPYINRLIELSLQQLCTDLSPTKKSEISQIVHNSFQAYLFFIRSCIQHSDNEDKLNFVSHVEKLTRICSNIFEHKDVSTETKNIFSMIIIVRNNYLNNNNHYSIISNDMESLDKRLSLIFGVVQIENDESLAHIEEFCNILEMAYYNNSVDNGMVYTISRLFMQIFKKLSIFKSIDSYQQISAVLTPGISIAFLNLNHTIESIRYISKDTIKNVIELGSKISDGSSLIENIFEKISALPTDLTASVVGSIHSIISVKGILERIPDLLERIVTSISMNKENKISCYITLSNKACSEFSFENWYEDFIRPLEGRIKGKENTQEEITLLKELMLKCIKKEKKAIEILLKNRNDFDKRFNFMILNLAKEEGLLKASTDDDSLWRGIISYSEIMNAMVNIDIDIRLSALYLIVDTKKVTDRFSQREIECILFFFEHNIGLQIPSTKQSMIGSIKKIFARLKSTIQYMMRKNKDLVNGQLDILVKFCEFSIRNLNSEANYSRRSLSLILLINIHEILKEYFPDEIANIWTKPKFDVLYSMLYDTYEYNKDKTLEVMGYIPLNVIKSYSDVSFEYLEKLHKSIKPADSSTASYLMLYCIKYARIESKDLFSDQQSYLYELITWCEKQLTDALEIAEKSIIVAAGSNPMYGFISSIRIIISKINFNDIKTCSMWKNFFERLILIIKRLTKVAAPIVNDSSPEGIYPNENFHLLINDENEIYLSNIIQNTTSQMILLCAWRIIKECSLLFGDLSTKASLLCGSANELYSVNQLLDIGDHFLESLTNIKHRGAFEQCYSGFLQYCYSLTSSHCFELHNLPSKIIKNILGSMTENSDDLQDKKLIRMKNLCSTRRSAGLPFIMQALLLAEIKISKYENFHFTMKTLLDLGRCGSELEARIHSLNILRVLYKCKELNDVINEYISEGIKISILGCASRNWSERNSSTLLFSALMIRIFGVQRNKDSEEIDIKNKLSSKIFFLRYPELYDFFMEQLRQSSSYVRKQEIDPKLFPLLLILNRLFTSNTEKCESNLKLVDFIPMVTACSGCVDLKARILCAKFVAHVNPINGIIPRIVYNIDIINECIDLTSNDKHARLLEILYLLQNVPDLQINQMLPSIMKIQNDLFDLLNLFKHQIICFTTILDSVIHIFQTVWKYQFKELLSLEKLDLCFDFDKSAYFGIHAMQSQLLTIKLIQMALTNDTKALSMSNSIDYYELLQKLNCIILIFNNAEKRKVIAEEYEIDRRIQFFVDNLSADISNRLRNELFLNEEFKIEVERLSKHKDFVLQARSFEILSLLCTTKVYNETEINSMLSSSLSKNDDYKIAILKYAKTWIQEHEDFIDIIDWKVATELLYSSYFVKISIIDLLNAADGNLCNFSLRTTFYYSTMIINLLMDDDIEISAEASKIVSNIIGINEIYIGSYAVQLYVKFLMKNSKFQITDKVFIFLFILFNEEKLSLESSDKDINEFQIFEKSESNSTREWFVMRDIIVSTIKDEMCNELDIPKLEEFCKITDQSVDSIEMKELITKLNLST
ncbi:tRNA (32-2'-O)-methyltransferase regulator THADA [Chironomus tepperi]|uniref:tRNA (32-2'-O)-methyltransferase regulator THADA n=1 Tax=Chironomus tepperi TaxID=113505 RepID=UPI00391EFA90